MGDMLCVKAVETDRTFGGRDMSVVEVPAYFCPCACRIIMALNRNVSWPTGQDLSDQRSPFFFGALESLMALRTFDRKCSIISVTFSRPRKTS